MKNMPRVSHFLMKCRSLLLIVVFVSTGFMSAQTSMAPAAQSEKAPSTAIEAFMGKRGRMIIRDSYDIGTTRSTGTIKMDALVIYEPNSAQKVKGLRVEVQEAGRFERSSTSFIDFEELDGLSQALAYLIDLENKWSGQPREPYTEVSYTSKGEFEVGFYKRGNDRAVYCKSGRIGAATAFLTIADLPKLKAFVDQAISVLKTK